MCRGVLVSLSLFLISISAFAGASSSNKSTALVVYKVQEHNHEKEGRAKAFAKAVLFFYAFESNPQLHLLRQLQTRVLAVKDAHESSSCLLISNDKINAATSHSLEDKEAVSTKHTAEMLNLEDKKALDLVVNYFFANHTMHHLHSSQSQSSLPTAKQLQRSGAFLMRYSFLASEFLRERTWIGPAFGLFEKSVAKYIFSSTHSKIEKSEHELHEIEKTFDEVSNESLSHQQLHYKTRAKQVLLRKLENLEHSQNEFQQLDLFLNFKMGMDFSGVAYSMQPELYKILEDWSVLYFLKVVVNPLQFYTRLLKLRASCSPIYTYLTDKKSCENALVLKDDLDSLESILVEGVYKNKPSLLSDSGRCFMASVKFITTLLSVGDSLDLLFKPRVAVAGAELIVASLASLYEFFPKQVPYKEIDSLVRALSESFEKNPFQDTVSENLDKYYKEYATLHLVPYNAPFSQSYFQAFLARKLIASDPQLLSYVILCRLAEDEEIGSTKMSVFLRDMLKVSEQDIEDWKDLVNFFGPDFKFTRYLVQERLRIGK